MLSTICNYSQSFTEQLATLSTVLPATAIIATPTGVAFPFLLNSFSPLSQTSTLREEQLEAIANDCLYGASTGVISAFSNVVLAT